MRERKKERDTVERRKGKGKAPLIQVYVCSEFNRKQIHSYSSLFASKRIAAKIRETSIQ